MDGRVPHAGQQLSENERKVYGSGCSGSRYLNGTLDMHLELETAFASFLHKEDSMIVSKR